MLPGAHGKRDEMSGKSTNTQIKEWLNQFVADKKGKGRNTQGVEETPRFDKPTSGRGGERRGSKKHTHSTSQEATALDQFVQE